MAEIIEPSLLLDELDRRILVALQADASITNGALAVLVHTSAPTCLRRVRRLVEQGVIERVVAIVAPEKVGAPLTAVIEVSLDRQGDAEFAEFEERVALQGAVSQCYRVSAGPDFVLIASVADMNGYQALARSLFGNALNVRNVRSFFSVKRTKFDTRVSLEL